MLFGDEPLSSFHGKHDVDVDFGVGVRHNELLFLYLALGNIALVFAAQVCRDSEIAGIPIRIYYGIAIRIGYGISIALAIRSLDPAVYGVFW